MDPKVSVIVPVYNIEDYLRPCLLSLRKQTFPDIEILLVDDGSHDRSGQICDQAAREGRRFRVIHQENQGIGKTRQTGVCHARGDWLMFVDGDDWVSPEFCEKALECALSSGAEICVFEYFEIQEYERVPYGVHQPLVRRELLDQEEALVMLAEGQIQDYFWNKIYRRSLLEGMTFPDSRLMEDMRTMCRIFAKASRFCLIPDRLYYYRHRKGSLTTELLPGKEAKEVLKARYGKYRYLKRICPAAAEAMDEGILYREMKYYACNYFVPAERRNLRLVRKRILAREKLPEVTTANRRRALGLLRRSGLVFAISWRVRNIFRK